jgi:hypothetical protein
VQAVCTYLHEEVDLWLWSYSGLLLPPGQLGHKIVLGPDALAPGGEVERLLDRHLADVHVGLADVRRRLLRHELVEGEPVVGDVAAGPERLLVQLPGEGEQQRGLPRGRRAEQQRHPRRPDHAGDVPEDGERGLAPQPEATEAQRALGHVARRVEQRRQRAAAHVAPGLHVHMLEPHLHRRKLDPHPATFFSRYG